MGVTIPGGNSMPALDTQPSAKILWRALRYLKASRLKVYGIYLTMALIQAILVTVPQLLRWLVDRGIYGRELNLLNLAIAGLLGLTLVKGILTFFQGKWTEEVSQQVAFDLRNEIQNKLNALSFSFHDQTEAGQDRHQPPVGDFGLMEQQLDRDPLDDRDQPADHPTEHCVDQEVGGVAHTLAGGRIGLLGETPA